MNDVTIDRDMDELERRLQRRQEPPIWERVRLDLLDSADAAGLVDVAFERHDCPLGVLVVGATSGGIVRVGLPVEDEREILSELAERISGSILRWQRPVLAQARDELDEYFAGQRQQFDVPLDWQLTRGFRREVLRATAEIPFGETATYRDVATRAGRPAAVRAAGSALATNPLPIFVPCHRVVRTGGEFGSYRGGAAAKVALLDLEGART